MIPLEGEVRKLASHLGLIETDLDFRLPTRYRKSSRYHILFVIKSRYVGSMCPFGEGSLTCCLIHCLNYHCGATPNVLYTFYSPIFLTSVILRLGAFFKNLWVFWRATFHYCLRRTLIGAGEHLCVHSQLAASRVHLTHILEVLYLVVYKTGLRTCDVISGRDLSRVENLSLCKVDISALQDWFRSKLDIFSDCLVSYHQRFQIHIIQLLLSIFLKRLNFRWCPIKFGSTRQWTLKEVFIDILNMKLIYPLSDKQCLLK